MKLKQVILLILLSVCISGCSRWYVKYGIAESELYQKESIPKAMDALKDEDPSVRKNAIKYLCKFGGQDAIDKIITIAESDNDMNIRKFAQEAIMIATVMGTTYKDYAHVKLPMGTSEIELTIRPSLTFNTGSRNVDIVKKHGILPINIAVKNLSQTLITVDYSFYKLLQPDGKIAGLVSAEEVSRKLKISYDRALTNTVLFGFLGARSILKTKTYNDKVSDVINESKIKSDYISQNESIEGYIFFNMPEDFYYLGNWKFKMGIKSSDGNLYIIEDDFKKELTVKIEKLMQEEVKPAPLEKKSLEQKIIELDNLLKKGLITQDDFDKKKNELLKEY